MDSIIEVPPTQWRIPNALEAIRATYKPYGRQKVRIGPGLDQPVKYLVSAGKTFAIVGWMSDLPFECWLCLEDGNYIALVINQKELGDIKFNG